MKQVTNRCQHICSCIGFHLYVLFTGQQSVQIITHSLMHICLWMIGGEIISHQLPAFPQTIQALAATQETVKADENEPFWKFPGVWLCSARLGCFCTGSAQPSPSWSSWAEHSSSGQHQTCHKILLQHLPQTGFSLKGPCAAALTCAFRSTAEAPDPIRILG